ncbi:MAG: hypothetical protein JWR80_9493 [Bradyrhizobium sp.]|nr:hypothetical protein [Bradyrhizobium sp.]
MPPAIIAAGIVAGGAIGGAVLSSNAQKSATNTAAAAQTNSTNAQLQLGQESLAAQYALAQQSMGLNRDIYNSNYDLMSPWVSRGNVAGDAYSALLGLPTAPQMQSPIAGSMSGAPTPTPTPTPVALPPPTGIGGNVQTNPVASQTPVNALATAPPATSSIAPYSGASSVFQYNPATGLSSLAPTAGASNQPGIIAMRQHAQAAIAAGADPAAVQARMTAMTGGQTQ